MTRFRHAAPFTSPSGHAVIEAWAARRGLPDERTNPYSEWHRNTLVFSERTGEVFTHLSPLRSDRPKPAFRKVIMDGDRRSDGRYLEISASSCPEGATLDWGWPPTYGSGPFALATPCTHVPGRYSGPSNFKSRVAHPWSRDIGSSTSAAQTSLNMVLSRRKARPFGLSTKLGLQENGRPSPKGTARWPGPCSMG